MTPPPRSEENWLALRGEHSGTVASDARAIALAEPVASHQALKLEFGRAPSLTRQDGTVVALGRKDAAMLCLLALDGSCLRDTLGLMLWPDGGVMRARASLRQRRYRLAHALGQAITEGEEVLRLAPGIRHVMQDPDTALAADPAALDGDLLEGQGFSDCPEFQSWLEQARENWRATRVQALARLASRFEAAGRVASALALAERLADAEPLSDHAHRRLMRLHHLRGDLGAALDVYRRFALRLEAELGELPDDETAELAAQLRLGQAPARMVPPTPASLRRPPRLVGRDAEWQALEDAWRERLPVVVEGAAGVGKTRLLADFIVQRADAGTLLMTSLLGDRSRPYALLVRLLGKLWLDADARLPRGFDTLPAWARMELAGLLPELGSGPAQASPLRLQRAVAAALMQSGLSAVGIDDVQHADEATLELLPSLQGPGLPLWWMSVRAGEAPRPTTEWLQSASSPRHISLAPFSAELISELLEDLALPCLAGQEWAARLARHTGGLPLYVLETLKSLQEHPEKDLASLPPATSALQSIRARCEHLPAQARQLAELLALWRESGTPEAAAHMLGGEPNDWTGHFACLEAARWVDESLRMHDLVSTAVADTLPVVHRRWLHARIASWLLALGTASDDVLAHLRAAGRNVEGNSPCDAMAREVRRASRTADEATLLDGAAGERRGARSRAQHHEAVHADLQDHLLKDGPMETSPA
jgi:DNA-binding SARP family transcriptional activator